MPQMAPIMWIFLAFLFLFLIYFLLCYLFFTASPSNPVKQSWLNQPLNLHWKW
uniref:ATP synthase complex subunit 8 n=1 Tax=Pseudoniphargus pityusensis TaxID=2211525 RepID=A0A345UDZ2_9CRUS|nr:ATP synthase F0 subunit 8 [Pseudoniphargus pityusensis]